MTLKAVFFSQAVPKVWDDFREHKDIELTT